MVRVGFMRIISIMVAAVMVCAAFTAIGPALALDPLDPDDALRDPDNDGLANLEEFVLGCDPLNPDTDGDGLPDGWEGFYSLHPTLYDYDGDGVADRSFVGDVIRDYRFDPNDRATPLQDPDDDGLTNMQEYLAGTDPSNPNTDWDNRVRDSEDPNPFVPEPNYRAVFGGSIYNPYKGPGTIGRAGAMAPLPARAPASPQGAGMAPGFARSMMIVPCAGGNGAGGVDSPAAGAGGRTLKYITRVVVDSSLPAFIEKGDPFTICGHVEYTTIQVDDGSNDNGHNNENGNDHGNNGQDQEPGGNPGNPNPPGQSGGNNGQNQQPGGNQGPPDPSPGNPGGHGNDGQDTGSGNGGQNHGDYPGQGDGGQDGQGHGNQGNEPVTVYWYWWHGPADVKGGRSSSGRGDADTKWYPIDQTMDISIQLNTSRGVYGIGSGKADQLSGDNFGYFTITCIVPGAAPAGEGKVAIRASANSYYLGCWWEEGRDG